MNYPITADDMRRFWKKVRISDSGCWEWVGSFTTDKGSGQVPKMELGGQQVTARRIAYVSQIGSETPKQLHPSCGNGCCVNPWHLSDKPCRDKKTGKVFRTRDSSKWTRTDKKLVGSVLLLRKLGRSYPQICRKLGVDLPRAIMIVKLAKMCEQGKLQPAKRRPKVVA